MTRRERIQRKRRGTNQHQVKYRSSLLHGPYGSLLILPVFLTIGIWTRHFGTPVLEELRRATTVRSVEASTVFTPVPASAFVESAAPAPTASPTPSATPTPEMVAITYKTPSVTAEEIEAYIRKVFGAQGEIAVAVSRRECSPGNAAYPACVLHTEHEYSVGVFQINLFNSRGWVHAAKVPGTDMAEKIAWLKNPFNNVDMAYRIYTEWGGFNAWSAYTNGAYLKEMRGGDVR